MQGLSLWKPGKTSIARASAFNRYNIGKFFELLTDVFSKYNFPSHCVYNLVETPVQCLPRQERSKLADNVCRDGVLVTLVGIACGSENTMPPAFVFPRANYKPQMLVGVPPGSLGLAHTSEWMPMSNFMLVIRYFVKYSKLTVEDPVLLVLDNHVTHLSFSVLDYAKNNHVHLLTMLLHTSNKTQPLDRTIFGPAKCVFNVLLSSRVKDHPHQPVTIYDMAWLMGSSFLSAATPQNIIRGFKTGGNCPLKPNIFIDANFDPSKVTDQQSVSEYGSESAVFVELTDTSASDSATSKGVVSPRDFKGFPKA
ncbi:unnamed protein product [Lepeophtheirus salmonis]|uniref:(salmon louse) hypothetical protein n=1 Tax=Lepeophtheirus salmonis TaxID=72036 RepID=A0A7R8CLD3_LEPSM|nr:unnamed protein product [Lepeophtheirus salmonis]CAF2854358.1 unnamed protein product [Lepeophtheirus salmonis]